MICINMYALHMYEILSNKHFIFSISTCKPLNFLQLWNCSNFPRNHINTPVLRVETLKKVLFDIKWGFVKVKRMLKEMGVAWGKRICHFTQKFLRPLSRLRFSNNFLHLFSMLNISSVERAYPKLKYLITQPSNIFLADDCK